MNEFDEFLDDVTESKEEKEQVKQVAQASMLGENLEDEEIRIDGMVIGS